MRFKKVIYIRYIPLTSKIFLDFYMNEVENAGIEVEYWDITELFFKNNFEQEDSSHLVNTRKFKTYKELSLAFIREQQYNSNTLYVSIMTFEGRVAKLYRMFTKYNCTLAVFGRNIFPQSIPGSVPFLERIRYITINKVISYLKTRKAKKQKENGDIKKYDVLFLGGSKGWNGIGNIEFSEVSHAEMIKVNSDDYDQFLKVQKINAERIVKGDYILFLDEYLPLHPDAKLFGISNVSPEQYYPQLCEYFNRIELQFKMPVVIAAHPKALKYKEEDYFDGRGVYFEKTAELSKNAYFVLAHDSTSISYPIAFNKKIHFITSKNIERNINQVHKNVLLFSEFLGSNYQFFDDNNAVNLIENIEVENYKRYKFDFQTWPETQDRLTKDIFIDFLLGTK